MYTAAFYKGKKQRPGVAKSITSYKKTPGKAGVKSLTKYKVKRTGNVRVGGLTGLEYKFKDQTFAQAQISNLWSSSRHNPAGQDNLAGPLVGSGPEEHGGRVYFLTSLHITGYFKTDPLPASTEDSQDVVIRYVVALDTQTNNSAVQGDKLFKDDPLDPELNFTKFRDLENTARLTVLKDRTIHAPRVIAFNGTAGQLEYAGLWIPFKCNIKLKQLKVRVTGPTGGIGDIADNSLHFFAITSKANGNAPDDITLSYTVRCRFTEG